MYYYYQPVTGRGIDYDSGPYNITFLAGMDNVSFDVQINDDNVSEGNESFMLNIVNASLPSHIAAGTPGNATANIIDDDSK